MTAHRTYTPYPFTVTDRKGRLRWYLRWYVVDDEGQTVARSKSLGITAPAKCPPKALEAYRARAQVEAFRLRQQFLDGFRPDQELPAKDLKLDTAIDRYAATLQGRYASAGEMEQTLREWATWLAGRRRTVNALGVADVNEYVTHRLESVKHSTAQKELARIAVFLEWASDEGMIPRPIPLKAVRKSLTVTHTEPPPLADETIRTAIESQPTPHRRGLMLVLACTGLRADELASLPAGAVDVQEALLRVPAGLQERTKHHGRVIPLPPGCLAFLGPLVKSSGPLAWDGERLFPDLCRHDLYKMLARCPDPGRQGRQITPKRFRQFFASSLKKLAAPEFMIRAVLGHVAPGNLKSYETAGLYDPHTARVYVKALETALTKGRTPCETTNPTPPPPSIESATSTAPSSTPTPSLSTSNAPSEGPT